MIFPARVAIWNWRPWLKTGLVLILGLTALVSAVAPVAELEPEERQRLLVRAEERNSAVAPVAELEPEVRQKLLVRAEECNRRSIKFYLDNKLTEAQNEARQALAISQMIYPVAKYPDGHSDKATYMVNLGDILKAMGRLEHAREYFEQAALMRRRLYPDGKYPIGHPDLLNSLYKLASVVEAMGQHQVALNDLDQALIMARRLYPEPKYPDGHADIAIVLNNLGLVMQSMGRNGMALDYYKQALAMQRRLFPDSKFPEGQANLALGLNNLGSVYQEMNRLEEALVCKQQAFAILEKLYPADKYPDGDAELATLLNNIGGVLREMGRNEAALEKIQQAITMMHRLYPAKQYPDGHRLLAPVLSNLGSVLRVMGRHEDALNAYLESLAMRQRLYPASKYHDGHPELAATLNELGLMMKWMGRPDLALDPYLKALAMKQRLYPAAKYHDGHPSLATTLNNLGTLLEMMGQHEPALDYFKQGLEMRRRLYPESKYPDGHPDLTTSVSNYGSALQSLGRYKEAFVYFKQALDSQLKLYPSAKFPEGHPDLAASLLNLGTALQAMGQHYAARDVLEQALVMNSGFAKLKGYIGSESDALNFWFSLPPALDLLLSSTQLLPGSDTRMWAHVWRTRSAITSISESRHESLFTDKLPPDARDSKKRLDGVRHQLARVLTQPFPTTSADCDDRARLVSQLTKTREELERDLARLVPVRARSQPSDRFGATDLEAVLPQRSAFVDLLRYIRFTYDPQMPGNSSQTRVAHYVAFVVKAGQPVVRVELGPAALIDKSVGEWREAIALGRESRAAEKLRDLVWKPIVRHLARNTGSVYFVPDGDLARLPWAALPGSKPGTVLLEELAIAVVPHGPSLVQHLNRNAESQAPNSPIIVVGGVDYDQAPTPVHRPSADGLALLRSPDRGGAVATWRPLPGTERELRLVCERAGPQSRPYTGVEASTTRLLSELPLARRAHLGTHGFFMEAAFRDEQRRAAEAIRDWKLEPGGPRGLLEAGAGARSPLTYTGLVLAGANHPETAGPDGGILTGEMLLGLDLRGLELAVLSACQTSLGEVAGGQCVQNLQRAFHVAGCRDVIASLWNLPDGPTATLMDAFYKELLENNQQPLEALRTAQLYVYRNPHLIGLDTGRGAPIIDQAAKLPRSAAAKPAGDAGRRAAVRDWAGFILSGPGL